jgi:hypothetical protein
LIRRRIVTGTAAAWWTRCRNIARSWRFSRLAVIIVY